MRLPRLCKNEDTVNTIYQLIPEINLRMNKAIPASPFPSLCKSKPKKADRKKRRKVAYRNIHDGLSTTYIFVRPKGKTETADIDKATYVLKERRGQRRRLSGQRNLTRETDVKGVKKKE